MALDHALVRRLFSGPPDLQTRIDMNPTLLVSWFCTIFSLVIIIIRVMGRWVRTEMLFREDKVMCWSVLPLLARMAFVHVILLWGTNNTITVGLTADDIQHRAIASKLVLVSRIIYAAYIWIAKITVLEFVQRLIGKTWTKFYEIGTYIIYGFLAVTFVGVVVSTLTECHPFNHYWQVVPDPGPRCRSGAAQLITMGTCDIVTDVVLIVFPIPLVVMSRMPLSKKVSLILLFLLSTILIAITAFRIPSTIDRKYSQQYRSLLASLEILAATAVANGIAIGSYLRDKGVKKVKYRAASIDTSNGEGALTLSRSRTKSVAAHHWGSDEDLVAGIGISLQPALRHGAAYSDVPRPAPAAEAAGNHTSVMLTPGVPGQQSNMNENWNFRRATSSRRRRESDLSTASSSSSELKLETILAADEPETPISPGGGITSNKMSFFDVGGLIDQPTSSSSSVDPSTRRASMHHASTEPPRSRAFLSDIGGLLGSRSKNDDEIRPIPPRSEDLLSADLLHPDDRTDRMRKSSQFSRSRSREPRNNRHPSPQPIPRDAQGPDSLLISDAGGLLG